MLIGDIFIRGDEVILKDVDGSEVTLQAEDAFNIYRWVYGHLDDVFEAMRRFDNKARRTQNEKMNELSQSEKQP